MKLKTLLTTILLAFLAFSALGQQNFSPAQVVKIDSPILAFGKNIPKGTLIYDKLSQKWYFTHAGAAFTETLATSLNVTELASDSGGSSADLGDFRFVGDNLEHWFDGRWDRVIYIDSLNTGGLPGSPYERIVLGSELTQIITFGAHFIVPSINVYNVGMPSLGELTYNTSYDQFLGKTTKGWVNLGHQYTPAHSLDSTVTAGNRTNRAVNIDSTLTLTAGMQLGFNVVSNGTFSTNLDWEWLGGSHGMGGWQWAGSGFAYVGQLESSSDSLPSTVGSAEIGATYIMSFDMDNGFMPTGELTPYFGGVAGVTRSVSTAGTFVDTIVAVTTDKFYLNPTTSVQDVQIDNVSVRKLEGFTDNILVIDGLGSMSGTPTEDDHLATKAYVDSEITGVSFVGVSPVLTTNTTLSDTLTMYVFNPGATGVIAALPSIASSIGTEFIIINADPSNNLIVNADGTDIIDEEGDSSLTLPANSKLTIVNSGIASLGWIIVSKRTYVP